jgi:hypothetical protein
LHVNETMVILANNTMSQHLLYILFKSALTLPS